METILVTYYSKGGHTQAMAEAIGEGVESEGGTARVAAIESIRPAELLDVAGLAVGSPVFYGLPAAAVKRFFDETVALHGRLAGKVGTAFASSANLGGGTESTCLALLQMMLVHGMAVLGAAQGSHYGPVSVGAPDASALEQCRVHGGRLASFVRALDSRGLAR